LGVEDPEISIDNWIFIKDNIIDISCGDYHVLIKDQNNLVFSFGLNNYGQLGLNDFVNRNKPTLIDVLNIDHIESGKYFSIISSFDNIYSFGSNLYGELGIDIVHRNISTPTLIPKFTSFKIKKISCGDYHSVILDTNGDVYTFGLNDVLL
jgi:alpha-tubulin suppressor-like RCC1 family protein